jgi:hypothetical protein
MAFSVSNVRRGTIGDLTLVAGDWTGSLGDDNGTYFKQRGRTYLATFTSFDSGNGPRQENPVSVGTNVGNATPVSIGNRNSVSTGRFLVIDA